MIDHIDGLAGIEERLALDVLNERQQNMEEPTQNHEDDFRDQQESTDSWLAAEEDKYLSSFSE